MKIFLSYFTIILFSNIFSQSNGSFSRKANKLLGTFSVYHPAPISLDNSTSNEVLELFIQSIAENGIYLKEYDVKRIKEAGNDLFSKIKIEDDSFIEKIITIYKQSLNSFDSILSIIGKEPLNFKDNDTAIFLPYNTTYYSPNQSVHTKRIISFIKSRSYDWVLNTDDYDTLSDKEFNIKAIGYSKSIISNLKKRVVEKMSNTDELIKSSMLNAIAMRHDPHSNFFTQEQNQNFSRSLSSQVESFGFYVDENEDGVIVISYIEPGGAAWLSNEINVGDIFVSARIDGNLINNENSTIDGIQDKMDNSRDKTVILTLKKQNGLTKVVKLMKQKVNSSDNTVRGYILSENGKKVGYISLPSFYTNMLDQNKPGCANDVAKEIIKLENDSISALILDLRNNGGGSMQEAMDLAGIFIDEGPLFIFKEKSRKPFLYKDINRGSIYKKPLIVIINELSASASELFCNVVKDYNAGVIVGQNSYGKGSSQIVLPLDTNVIHFKNMESQNNDFIKMTTGKFYRLNCSTHQGCGVNPDIIFPQSPAATLYKESKEPFNLMPDSVVKKVIYYPNKAINLAELNQRSTSRIGSSNEFKRYIRVRDSIDQFIFTTTKIPLKPANIKMRKKTIENLYETYETIGKTGNPMIKCRINSFDKKLTEVSEYSLEFNTRIEQSIREDIFIRESFNIAMDIINQ